MIAFLTSSHVIPGTHTLNPANGFAEALLHSVPGRCRTLYICSDPEDTEQTDFYGGLMRETLAEAGLPLLSYRILDGRNADQAAELVREADLIVLTGGHVPTQNRFFRHIGLRRLLRGWQGVLIGISAGSMNAAEDVYAQPEAPGEGVDPSYRKFLPGLGLTGTRILPHLQQVRYDILDGLRLFEDITLGDSWGRTFYAIPDGSYLLIQNGREELRGEAHRIRDGQMEQISQEGDVIILRAGSR